MDDTTAQQDLAICESIARLRAEAEISAAEYKRALQERMQLAANKMAADADLEIGDRIDTYNRLGEPVEGAAIEKFWLFGTDFTLSEAELAVTYLTLEGERGVAKAEHVEKLT